MEQTYTSEEVKQLLLYVAQTQKENEELRLQMKKMTAVLDCYRKMIQDNIEN